MSPTTEQQVLTVSPEQARLLTTAMSDSRIGLVETKLGRDGDLFTLNDLLHSAQTGEQEVIPVPPELSQVLRGCAQLVVQAELEHTAAQIRTGRVAGLAGRAAAGLGFDHKLAMLTPFLDRNTVSNTSFIWDSIA